MPRPLTIIKEAFGEVDVCNNCNPFHRIMPELHEWKRIKAKNPPKKGLLDGVSGRSTTRGSGANAVRSPKRRRSTTENPNLFE